MPKLYETITAENWGKGHNHLGASFLNPSRKCFVEHLTVLFGTRWTETQTAKEIYLALWTMYPERSGSCGPAKDCGDVFPHIFNDHPDTTVEDVIRVCKVADV